MITYAEVLAPRIPSLVTVMIQLSHIAIIIIHKLPMINCAKRLVRTLNRPLWWLPLVWTSPCGERPHTGAVAPRRHIHSKYQRHARNVSSSSRLPCSLVVLRIHHLVLLRER